MEMKKYKLGDILVNHDRRRIPLSSKVRSGRKGNFRYYGAQGVVDYIDDYIFDGEYVLIAEDGENLRSRNQNVANLVSGQFWVNNHAHIVTTNEKCDLHYFYYAFNFLQIDGYISGSAQPKLSQDSLNRIEMTIPDLQTQKGIASFLFTIDKRIENLHAQNRVLEQTAKTIYDYTFLQCAGHQTTYNKTLNRNIPTNWEVKSVNQMAKSCRGVAYDKSDVQKENNGGILVLRGNNIQDNNLVYDGNVVYIPETLVEENQHIKKGDVIMTMSSGSKEHIGKCTMFQYDSEHTYGAFLTKFTPNKECRYYFYMNLISEYFKAKIKSVCNGTGINNLTNQTFDEIFFPYPDSKTLDTFEKTVTPIFDKMGVNTKQIESLTTQRNTLLPLFMTGQVEV